METTFKSNEDKQKFIAGCKQNCSGDTTFIKYLGCFIDDETRDLKKFIGYNMKITDCFARANEAKYKYVGLQYGGECWGSADGYGTLGRAKEEDCSMVCKTDSHYTCGNSWRNSIYNVGDYKETEQKTVDCTGVPKRDCTSFGGYDPKDKCNGTCINDGQKEKCLENCFTTLNMVPLAFKDCANKCQEKENCPDSFVDCSGRGGYDTIDNCKQTCNIKEDTSEEEACTFICRQDIHDMLFANTDEEYNYFQGCT